MSAPEDRHEEPRSSVALNLNAKGEGQLAVKVYHEDPEEARRQAQEQFEAGLEWLRRKGLRG